MSSKRRSGKEAAISGIRRSKVVKPNYKNILNQSYTDDGLLLKLKELWSTLTNQSKHEVDGVIIHKEPFTCCELNDFISDNEFMDELVTELENLEFYEKHNDLYKFVQSDDLKTVSTHNIQSLKQTLYEDFRRWLATLTEIPLTEVVDMTCAKYEYTDYLLCHDDELEGRRIAFILYLVPKWESRDGGLLDLFVCNDQYEPTEVVKSLVPSWNKLVFFEVSPVSYHQVTEVLSESKTRLSVSGWFHGPPLERHLPVAEPSTPISSFVLSEDFSQPDWIHPMYESSDAQEQISLQFEEESEVSLVNFLNDDIYNLICCELKDEKIKWERKGPANKRNFEVADEDSLLDNTKSLIKLLHSPVCLALLSNCTGLEYRKAKKSSGEEKQMQNEGETSSGDQGTSSEKELNKKGSGFKCEVRRWSHGCYTLLQDTEEEEEVLDVSLFFNSEGLVDKDAGGIVSYITRGEDEELLSIPPQENTLHLVYRNEGVMRFVNYINHRITEDSVNTCYFEIRFWYYE